MKQINPYWKAQSALWAFLFIAWLILFLLAGCVTEKKIIQRSVMKVLTTKSAFDTVGRIFVDLHPCVNDTVYRRSDTTITHDTAYVNYWNEITKTDTLIETITKKIIIRDTLTIKDKRQALLDAQEIQRLYREIQQLYNNQSGLNATIEGKDQAIQKADKQARTWFWYFIAAVSLLVGSNVFFIYSKYKL